jgi:hypothetical protein
MDGRLEDWKNGRLEKGVHAKGAKKKMENWKNGKMGGTRIWPD